MMATSSNSSSRSAVFEDDGLVGSILSFLPLTFRFTAAVNRRFQRCYREVHHTTATSFQYCVHTVAAAKIWVAETGHDDESLAEDWACNVAVQFGRLKILQYFKKRGYDWSSNTCAIAARNGHLLVLQWMRTRNKRWGQCPWDKYTCFAAARNGHLHVLQWARANGCDWDAHTCSGGGRTWTPPCPTVGESQWVRLGRMDLCVCGPIRTS
jgi:hypothetical protein